jgi:hypothetical protein
MLPTPPEGLWQLNETTTKDVTAQASIPVYWCFSKCPFFVENYGIDPIWYQ